MNAIAICNKCKVYPEIFCAGKITVIRCAKCKRSSESSSGKKKAIEQWNLQNSKT